MFLAQNETDKNNFNFICSNFIDWLLAFIKIDNQNAFSTKIADEIHYTVEIQIKYQCLINI